MDDKWTPKRQREVPETYKVSETGKIAQDSYGKGLEDYEDQVQSNLENRASNIMGKTGFGGPP